MVSALSQQWEKGILACFRSSDCGDNAEMRKGKTARGWGRGWEPPLSPSSSLFFSSCSPWICASLQYLNGYRLFRYKVVSIQVNSLKVCIVLRTWLKKRKVINIHPKRFSCSIANFTWGDRNFCAISLLEFVSKRLVSERLYIETTGFHLNAWNRQKGSVSSVLKRDVQ